jgi:hypothetical protein
MIHQMKENILPFRSLLLEAVIAGEKRGPLDLVPLLQVSVICVLHTDFTDIDPNH